MPILVTGAKGFIGTNLVIRLKELGHEVIEFGSNDNLSDIDFSNVSFVFHLAGVNRSSNADDFFEVNDKFTNHLISRLKKSSAPSVVFSSTIHVSKDTDYAKSKLQAEIAFRDYEHETGANVWVCRLPNVFGKWSKPNYNTVVATWCHQISRGIDIMVSDPEVELQLIYVDDLVDQWIDLINTSNTSSLGTWTPSSVETISLGDLAETLISFKQSRNPKFLIPSVGRGLQRKLYSTFLTFLPEKDFSYDLVEHVDERGKFAEILRTDCNGQFSVSTSMPGVTRGNHYHHTKNEKFVVVKGKALIQKKHVLTGKTIEFEVSDNKFQVVDMVCGYTHNITNIGDDEMVLIIWANENFDEEKPDTVFLEV